MATKKKSRGAKPRRKKRRVVVVRKTVVRVGSRRSKGTAVTRAKATIRKNAEGRLKEGLFARDKAKTRKQHKAAQNKIDNARKDLRRFN